jgi:hypothetical protein
LRKIIIGLWLTVVFVLFCFAELRAETFHVTSSADNGPGTLREAVAASNTTAGVQTISLETASPILLSSSIYIQQGVVIEGHGTTIQAAAFSVFYLQDLATSGGCWFKNLILDLQSSEMHATALYFYSSSGNTVTGCVIRHAQRGISGAFSDDNIIGGDRSRGEGNVIIANNDYGICLENSNRNYLCGNIIGLSPDQTQALGNGKGISLAYCSDTVIGDFDPHYGNIIAANQYGIYAYGSNPTVVRNNLIGINSNSAAFGNSICGISIQPNCRFHIENNTVAANLQDEIYIGSFQNTVVANRIGTNRAGTEILPGAPAKITIAENNNGIGGLLPGQGNLIAGGEYGIAISEFATVIQMYGNTICGFSNQGIHYGRPDKQAPVITFANPTIVFGISGPGDYIEVFMAEPRPNGYGGSWQFLGQATADSLGHWQFALAQAVGTGYLCATAALNNYSSEFSLNYPVSTTSIIPPNPYLTPTPVYTPTATPTITPTPWLANHKVVVFPNPARERVSFAFTASGPVRISIDLYKISGERAASLRESRDAGAGATLTTVWNTGPAAPGIYLARILVTDESGKVLIKENRKVALLRLEHPDYPGPGPIFPF